LPVINVITVKWQLILCVSLTCVVDYVDSVLDADVCCGSKRKTS